MKRILLFFTALFFTGQIMSQNVPIANDDYFDVYLGETVTINVTANDSHPDNIYFYVFIAPESDSFTDSTITFNIDYEKYYNVSDTLVFIYVIKDENGNVGDESTARIYLIIKDNDYFDFLDHNNLKARIQASGVQFWPGPIEGSSSGVDIFGFEFPKGSGKNTIFNSSLWVGGMDDSEQLHLSAERYRMNGLDYWPGPLSVSNGEISVDIATVIKWQNVWKLTKEEVIYHKLHYWEEGYIAIDDIASWPAHGDLELNQTEYLAPFIDVDGDSIYNPMSGDYPLIRGEQCIYFIINDVRSHGETGGEALGLEIHGMAYEFYDPENLPMSNTVFFSYKIFNRSSHSYHDTYVGLFTDFDIGNPWDDYVGCDVNRGAYYGYNGDSIDETSNEYEGYGNFIPAQGIVILGGPLMDANGVDDPKGQCDEGINGVGFSDGTVDNERYGMKKFLYFESSLGVQGDPQEAMEYYGYLKSIWKDGTAMEYGGNGHISSGAYGPAADFMFPGLTDPCFWGTGGEEPYGPIDWTEVSAGNEPGDRRGLSVMGPFTFEPGTMERIDIAYVSAFPEGDNSAVETLMEYIDVVKGEYYLDPTYFGYQWLGVEDKEIEISANKLIAYPNPVTNILTFDYTGEDLVANYRVMDIMGKVILTGEFRKTDSQTLDLTKLKSGLYILTVSDTNNTYSTKVIKN